MTRITPVILAGGSGTRLWPLSRKNYPKQFSKIFGEKTLFQETVEKFQAAEELEFSETIILTSSEFRFIAAEQLQASEFSGSSIVIEPVSRNTAPAILTASYLAIQKDKEAILLVTPSDHIIPDQTEFLKAISVGKNMVEHGDIVTFGVTPTRSETGYGYLKIEKSISLGPQKLLQFIEKPDKILAEKMFKSGSFLWNAGIFLFRAIDMVLAFEKHSPELIEPVKNSLKSAKYDLDFLRLAKEPWEKCANISIDYAIMEKIENVCVVPFSGKWSDLGGWNAVWEEQVADEKGVALSNNATAIDCENVLLRSEDSNQEIVGIGLKNLIAVAMPDAVLVVDKNKDQSVKEAVNILKKKNVTQSEIFPKDHRPWGWFESLALGENFQVKRIVVKSGASLSLQSHRYRSENWVVVSGVAKVTTNNEIKYIKESETAFIPMGVVHRLENESENELIIIEVQTGSYLGEDDIIRYEDNFNRA